jgi:protein arginine kinase
MILDDLLYKRGKWLEGTGSFSDVVISSRVRLARNLKAVPFSHRASVEKLTNVVEYIQKALKKSKYLSKAVLLKLGALSELDRRFLFERHLISAELASLSKKVEAVVIEEEEMISIMINEEDHLRLQVLQAGLQLVDAWRVINTVDNELEEALDYAFSPLWGYLTACPTNTGTGMRASVMLHLPALIITKKISRVFESLSQLHLEIRGLYGEGTSPTGGFFQVSNRITLGQKEENIIDNLEGVIKQVVFQEKQAREELMKRAQLKLEDRVFRALGVLKNARIINSAEVFDLLSSLRLGVHLKIIEEPTIPLINELLILTQPAHLQKMLGQEVGPKARDIKRAEFIRHKLREIN